MNCCRLVGLAFAVTLSFVTLALCDYNLFNFTTTSRDLIPVSRLRDIAERVNALNTGWEAFIATLSVLNSTLRDDQLLNLKEKSRDLIPVNRLRDTVERVNGPNTTSEAFIATLSVLNSTLRDDQLLNLKEKSRDLKPVSRLRDLAERVNSLDTTWEAELPESWIEDDTLLDNLNLMGTLNPKLIDLSEFEIKSKSKQKLHNNDDSGDDNDDSSDSDDDDSEKEKSKKKKKQNKDKAVQCVDNGLPKSFDARDKWPKCKSLMSHIYDQGNCGSSWAVSAVSAFTDRLCIQSDGQYTELRSVQQVLSCCNKGAAKDGCHGGWPIAAFDYIRKIGLSTGGDYDSKKGCQPYRMKHYEHHINISYLNYTSYPLETAHKCKLHCYNTNYDTPFKKDRIKVKSFYLLDSCDVMNDIHKHGPVVAAFAVYEDFLLYKKGVYQHTTGSLHGWHSVRVIGWGEEKGTPYWLATNSWNVSWGDEGYFKIIRDSPRNGYFQETVAGCIVDV